MQDYQLRVIEERDQLRSRIEKLRAFMDTEAWTAIDELERGRMLQQLDAMELYFHALDARINAF